MNVTGKCFCGYVTYKAKIDPDRVVVCHCSDCQQHSGAAFGVVVSVVNEQFELISGQLKSYVKVADSGNTRELTFCPECGTRVYAKNTGENSGFFGLRYGTIEQRNQLTPKIQVWCRSSQNWAMLDSIPKLDMQT